MEMTIKRVAGILCFIIGILTAFFFVQAYMEGKFDSAATLREYIAGFGMLGPFILGALQAFQVVIPILPGFIGCAAGAILFGCMGGFWCNYIGICAGSVLAFLIARRYGIGLIRLLFSSERYERWAIWAGRSRSFSLILFLMILLPLCPDDYFCYLSGITGMSARKFTAIILLGKPWCILAYSVAFSHFLGA
ncbi:TVP38/TMEM64 family protein [Otoolea muris]|uniref:TVP38/TMEM64 family protein n=1 Tax=Otoolea muris TaxID=2941515 RepID=UPI00203EC5F1|nr:VTT domain-containing protein [Otoolea muris]